MYRQLAPSVPNDQNCGGGSRPASRPWRVVFFFFFYGSSNVVTPCNSNIQTICKNTIVMGAKCYVYYPFMAIRWNPGEIDLKSETRLGREGWASWSRGQLICGHHGKFDHFIWILLGISWIVQSNCFFGICFDMGNHGNMFPKKFTNTSLKRCGFWYVSTAMFWWLLRGIPCWQKPIFLRCLFCRLSREKNGMHLESHSIPAICKHWNLTETCS